MTAEQVPAESLSDTPRTDAVRVEVKHLAVYRDMVPASFARQLERELTQWKTLFEKGAILP